MIYNLDQLLGHLPPILNINGAKWPSNDHNYDHKIIKYDLYLVILDLKWSKNDQVNRSVLDFDQDLKIKDFP